MDLKLKDKRALVTGSATGIGAAIAAGLAREGARVIVTGRSSGGVEKAVREFKAKSGGDLLDSPGTLERLRRSRHWFAAIPTLRSWSTTSASLSRSRSRTSRTPTGFGSSRSMF